MDKLTGWKSILFLIIMILVTIRILYIGVWGEVDKEYFTSTVYDLSTTEELPCQNLSETFMCNSDRLHSLEFIFCNIAGDKKGSMSLAILKGEDVVYQTNISLSNINNWEWKRIYINIDVDEGKEYTITLNSNDDCTQIPNVLVVNNRGADEIISARQNGIDISGKIAINFGYLRFPGRIDRLSIISLWLLLLMAAYVLFYNYERIKIFFNGIYIHVIQFVRPDILVAVLEVLAGIIIINCSGIEFQEPTKIIVYIISLFSIAQYDSKRRYINEIINSTIKRVLIYLLYSYSAFSLVGQRILIYPLNMKLTVAGVFVFLVTMFWFIPVVDTLLYYLEIMGKKAFTDNGGLKTIQFVLTCTVVLLLPAMYNLLANNPGISSMDTSICMIDNARHLKGMNDWHPAFYCMILRAISKISDTTYAVIIVQYFFWAYVMNEILLFLKKKGMRTSILIVVAVFAGFNAGNFLHINTIWKDIPYSLSLLWSFIILSKLSLDYEENKRKWYIYLEFVIAMTGIYLYRKNGIVSFIIILLCAIILLRKNIKVWISAAVAVMLIVMVKGPIYDYYEVESTGRQGLYIGLGQDILGTYFAGGEVSEDTLKMITMMTDNNNAEYTYTPTRSNASGDVNVAPIEFIKSYVDTFLKNPVLMLRAIIDREDALWDIFVGRDSNLACVDYHGTEDNDTQFQWNNYYPQRHYVSLYTNMSAATRYTATSQWISAIEWRCGLFTLLGLISMVFIICRMGWNRHLVIIAPIIGQIVSLLLSTGWSDFRYFWPLNLLNMALILMTIVITRPKLNYDLR